MAEYLAPGVYVEETSFRAPSIAGVGTTTTGFAGPTLTGPVGDTPQLLTCFGDFSYIYGGYDDLSLSPDDIKNRNYLALGAKAFFDNGGSMLYVSRVFVPKSTTDAGTASAGNSTVGVAARFPGSFLNNKTVTVGLNAAKTQNVGNLPAGSLLAALSPAGTLSSPVTAGATTVTVSVPFAPAAVQSQIGAVAAAGMTAATTTLTLAAALTTSIPTPSVVQVEAEQMTVTAIDAGKTKLTVTRAANATAAAVHAAGKAVLLQIGAVAAAGIDAAATTLTLAAALTAPTPTVVQVEAEQMTVTAIDAGKTNLTVTRGANGTTAAAHAAGKAVQSSIGAVAAAGLDAAATTLTLAAALTTPMPSLVQVEAEQMTVTAIDAGKTNLTVTRGANGTTAAAHAAGKAVSSIAALPAPVLVDSEQMTVTAIDVTKTTLTVTRGVSGTTAAAHAESAAVLSPIGALAAAMNATTTTLTLASALTILTPTSVQVEGEQMTVTAIDATKTTLTVTRGTTPTAHPSAATVFSTTSPVTLYANGTSGSFANGGSLLPTPPPAGLYLLTLRVTAPGASGASLVYDGLGLDSAHPSYLGKVLGAIPPRHIDALQNQVSFTLGGAALTDQGLFEELFLLWAGPPSTVSKVYTLGNGNDGLEPTSTDYDDALQLFEGLEDIAIVAAPGSSAFNENKAIINSLITHVSRERAYRIAVLDTPPDQIASDNEEVRAHIDSSYAALYVPWVITPNPLFRSGSALRAEIAVPPSGFIAGIYARSDEQTSVAKAPANEVVLGALDFERNITFAEQATLNPLGINCLRYFPDRGYRVWGARTATSDSEFMYVNVRRYLIYLEHSIDNGSQWAVFENNGPALWARVSDSIDSFLRNEFAEGRLLGNSPAEAYFVRCDRTTMTQNDLDQGRFICQIGVALLKPAEFVIFRIGQFTADARA